MIFKINEDTKELVHIDIPTEEEDVFIAIQSRGKIKYIKVDEAELPRPLTEAKLNKTYYKLDENDNIVVDEERTKEAWIDNKYQELEKFIYDKYPQGKQNSDLSDKIYYETILKASGYTDLEAQLVQAVTEFYEGKTIDEILTENNISEEDEEPITQLLKLGIRVNWVQKCKDELKNAIAEYREPVYPDFPNL